MRDPNAIISTEALGELLCQPNVRVYDCTTYNNPPPPGVDEPYIPVPGLATFREAHIPGADFLDLQGEFSDKSQRFWFMMPKDIAQLESAFARHGIGEGVRVVLYSIGNMMWSTRFWWMLRALGFDNVAVLDGGFDKMEGRKPRDRERRSERLSGCDIQGATETGTVRRQARNKSGHPRSRHRHRQRARLAVPLRSGAQPLRRG